MVCYFKYNSVPIELKPLVDIIVFTVDCIVFMYKIFYKGWPWGHIIRILKNKTGHKNYKVRNVT